MTRVVWAVVACLAPSVFACSDDSTAADVRAEVADVAPEAADAVDDIDEIRADDATHVDAAVDEVADTAADVDVTPEIEEPVPLPTVEGLTELRDDNPDPRIVEVSLEASENSVQLAASGKKTKLLNYNHSFPGPLLHARVGDRVIVHFTNALTEPTTIHWHGLRISDQMDGSPMIQNPVQPGETFTYDFVVPDAGTFWYHTHLSQIEQLERGLYGAIVVHEAAAPVFSAERIVVADDLRLDATNQVSEFVLTGHDLMAGRVGNLLLANGKNGVLRATIPRGGIERWRVVLASNALSFGLRIRGADVRVIATDGGLLPTPFALTRVDIAPGQRYDFEVRPTATASEVVLEALVVVSDASGTISEQPFALIKSTVTGEVVTPEPVYPSVIMPATTDLPDWMELLDWKLSAVNVGGKVHFTINGMSDFVDSDGEFHDHVLLHTFEPNVAVRIKLTSAISPAHPFHIHGQFFQIIERGGKAVTDEPGLRDTVYLRGAESATILAYMENPGRWMVHCHIAEHGENGMMADIQVGPPGGHMHGAPPGQ